jgi:hypothetical protein
MNNVARGQVIFTIAFFLIGLTGPISSFGQSAFTVRGGVTGNWADLAYSKQGVQIEAVDDDLVVLAWFTYGPDGSPLWLFGTGPIEGNRIRAEMLVMDQGVFPSADVEDRPVVQAVWGNVVIDFEDCNNAQMTWDSGRSGFDTGALDLVRVTAIEGLPCGAPERFERELRFSLDAAPGQWEVLFADYAVDQNDQVERVFEWTTLPEPLSDRRGLKVAGTNPSDDLAMQLETMIGGLEPSTDYEVVQELTFATNIPSNCVGVGGSPGESVYLHLGAAPIEPRVLQVFDEDTQEDRFVMNVAKANQSQDGEDAIVVGNLANSQDCEDGLPGDWELKTVSSAGQGFVARTDDEGRLWVFGGTDSGFESRSTYFVTDWIVRLRQTEPEA